MRFTIHSRNQIKSTQIKSNVGFRGEGKTGVPGEKPLGTEQRTNKLSRHIIGGRRVLNHCAIPAHLTLEDPFIKVKGLVVTHF